MKMTNKQKQLAELNHNLIYSYAHFKNLSVDKWYGLLAESLCKTAMVYDESRGEFSTLFFQIAGCDVHNERRKMQTIGRKHDVDKKPVDEHNIITCDYDQQHLIVLDHIKSLDSSMEKLIDLKVAGLTSREIADVLGVSQSTVNLRLRTLKAKYERSKMK